MNNLKELIKEYREKETGMIGLVPNPDNHSTDNGLLFSSTYIVMLSEEERLQEMVWFNDLVKSCEKGMGLYLRYPNFEDLNAHDDLTGITVASSLLDYKYSVDILFHGIIHHWSWNTIDNKWTVKTFFGRIPSFVAGVKAAIGHPLNLFDILFASLAYIGDTFVKKEETNGRCLLYLRQKNLLGKSFLLDIVIRYWKRKMMKLYPDGLKGLYRIYFGQNHPFTICANENFE